MTSTPTSLRAGWSTIDISPPEGTDMGGYWARPGPSTGIHDALRGSVLLFEAGEERVAVISADLVGLDADRADAVRDRVAAAISTRPETVLLCCSHTHAGPLSLSFRGMGTVPVDYVAGLPEKLAHAAHQAEEALAPCALSTTSADVELAINRRAHLPGPLADGRDPATLIPPKAHALIVQTSTARAVLVHYACHPVVLGGANQWISADYPGVCVRHVEEAAQVDLAMFVNGACGDLNPAKGDGDFEDVEASGLTLGQAIVTALGDARELRADTVAAEFRRIELPLCDPPSSLRTAAGASIDGLKLAIKAAARSKDLSLRRVPEARLNWARELLAMDSTTVRSQPLAVHGLRIGDLRLLGLEGEIFARYQIDLETADSMAWLCGYADGNIGYVPTADEYARGGYEIDDAFKVYPTLLAVAPESEAMLRASMTAVLEALDAAPPVDAAG